jgi:hypothetical protein
MSSTRKATTLNTPSHHANAGIHSACWKGHTDSVLCLTLSSSHSLWSGSEDATALFWDTRGGRDGMQASMRLQAPGAVTSIVLGETVSSTAATAAAVDMNNLSNYHNEKDSEVNGNAEIVSSRPDCLVYLSVDTQVLVYDVRYSANPILTQPLQSTTTIDLQCPDEINQLVALWSLPTSSCAASNTTNTVPCYLGAADDTGCVRLRSIHSLGSPLQDNAILSLKSEQDKASESSVHSLIHNLEAMVTSLAVRPWMASSENKSQPQQKSHVQKHKSNHKNNKRKTKSEQSVGNQPQQQSNDNTFQLASGGTDCTIKLWNVSLNELSLLSPAGEPASTSACAHTLPITTVESLPNDTATTTTTTRWCNPPMVHALSYSPSGRYLAGGLGDGSWIWVHADSGQLISRWTDAHASPIACVGFLHSSSNTASATDPSYYDRCLVTAGNDGYVVWWDVGCALLGDHANNDNTLDPRIYWNGASGTTATANSGNNNKHAKKATTKVQQGDDGLPQTVGAVLHGRKPNAMVCHSSDASCAKVGPAKVYLADTSNDITVYTLCSLTHSLSTQ